MDVIPLDSTLIKGSHGRVNVESSFRPVLITDHEPIKKELLCTDVHDIIWQHLTGE
jgi:hypothetical protein